MNFNDTFSLVLRNLSIEDYEKRIFNLKKFVENGHLQ
mgnify:CR=1 FL=1